MPADLRIFPSRTSLYKFLIKGNGFYISDMKGYFQNKIERRAERVVMHALLRELRQECGLNQQQFADRLGVPQPFVSNYETGERRLDVLELRQICLALGIPLTLFIEKLEARLADKD